MRDRRAPRPPGITGNPPSQEFPQEFPGISEFLAGIAGNFKNLVNFVPNFESLLS